MRRFLYLRQKFDCPQEGTLEAIDLNYYNINHDLRVIAHLIDTARCRVYIMNGEYDPSTGFREGEELVAKINGAVWIPIPGIGHFPMTEDYLTMKSFLMPMLDEIAAHPRGQQATVAPEMPANRRPRGLSPWRAGRGF